MRRSLLVVLLLTSSLLWRGSAQSDALSETFLQILNTTRYQAALPPVRIDPQLNAAAERHSADMAATERLTHVGSDGSQFWDRVNATGYQLDAGAENVQAVGMLAAATIFEQWYQSELHRDNLLNPAYIDIGLGYAQSENDVWYVTLLLAAQPNSAPLPLPSMTPSAQPTTATPLPTGVASATLLPTRTVPPTRTIAPTDDRIATIVAPLPTNTRDANAPVFTTNTAVPLTATLVPPDVLLRFDERSFLLLNVSGRPLNIANLRFESASGEMVASRWNTEFLTQPLTGFTSNDCLQAWEVSQSFQPKPDECRYRHAWIAVGDDALFWQDTPTFTVSNNGQTVAVCQVTAGQCAIQLTAQVVAPTAIPIPASLEPMTNRSATIRFEQIGTGIALLNVSSIPIDVSRLRFVSDAGVFVATRWNIPQLSRPLTALPAGDCLQIWPVNDLVQPAPLQCDVRHAWVAALPNEQFWQDERVYQVWDGEELIATCETRTPTCDVRVN